MEDLLVFGYGSLVNCATHHHRAARRATLRGWRRVWVFTTLRPVAYLSVEPADAEIDGLVARVPPAEHAALETRESAYLRQPIAPDLHTGAAERAAQIHTVAPRHIVPPGPQHRLRLSYIDVVVQGYLEQFGAAGVARFFDSTTGWRAPVDDDRAAPGYARHQPLSARERDLVDHHLNRLGLSRL